MQYVEMVVRALRDSNAYRATKFVSPKEIIRATRRRFRHKGSVRRNPRKVSNMELVLTIGRPNYQERIFIKDCVHVGEKFPIKKVQLAFARGVR